MRQVAEVLLLAAQGTHTSPLLPLPHRRSPSLTPPLTLLPAICTGVPALTCSADTRELLEKRWCQPSLSIVDLRPGQQQTRGDTCYR